jgi:hypothetical protein
MQTDHDKIRKLLALAGSNHDGEALSALNKVRELMQKAGISFNDLDIGKSPQKRRKAAKKSSATPNWADIFSGYDDWMEEQHPGHKAQCAAKRAERERKQAEYRAEVLAKYGGEKAALEPCEREKRLREALAGRLTMCPRPHQRWTRSIAGIDEDGAEVFIEFYPEKWDRETREAVEGALPMPKTIAEAKAEIDYWRERDREMEAAQNWNTGDYALDRTAYVRRCMISRLADRDLPAADFQDLLVRSRLYQDGQSFNGDIESAIHRDLERLVAHLGEQVSTPTASMDTSGHPSTMDTSVHLSTEDRLARIRDALLDDPSRTDRAIARDVGCSPTTVGKVRRECGATAEVRRVQRGGQMYEARSRYRAPE